MVSLNTLLISSFVISLLVCLCGFKKYVYFLSIGYGFSVAAIGLYLLIMGLLNKVGLNIATIIQCLLFIIYGFRLSGFLLIREIKNAYYRATLKEASGDEMPLLVKVVIWLSVGLLYVGQTAAVIFRINSGRGVSLFAWIGIVISIIGVVIESVADKQKSAQKAKNPNRVAMEGLYKYCRCPNYFGEIVFWTGVFVSGLDVVSGLFEWLVIIVAYICIVFVMFNGAQRLEKRQNKRCGQDPEYIEYTNKTPIIIPFLPIYHLYK